MTKWYHRQWRSWMYENFDLIIFGDNARCGILMMMMKMTKVPISCPWCDDNSISLRAALYIVHCTSALHIIHCTLYSAHYTTLHYDGLQIAKHYNAKIHRTTIGAATCQQKMRSNCAHTLHWKHTGNIHTLLTYTAYITNTTLTNTVLLPSVLHGIAATGLHSIATRTDLCHLQEMRILCPNPIQSCTSSIGNTRLKYSVTGPSLTVSPPLQPPSPLPSTPTIYCVPVPLHCLLSPFLLFLQNGFSSNPIPLGMTLWLFVQSELFGAFLLLKSAVSHTKGGVFIVVSFVMQRHIVP